MTTKERDGILDPENYEPEGREFESPGAPFKFKKERVALDRATLSFSQNVKSVEFVVEKSLFCAMTCARRKINGQNQYLSNIESLRWPDHCFATCVAQDRRRHGTHHQSNWPNDIRERKKVLISKDARKVVARTTAKYLTKPK